MEHERQLGSPTLAHRPALHGEVPLLGLPADVCEPQKIERLGLSFPSSFPVLFGEPPGFDPARLVWMEFQSKLLSVSDHCPSSISAAFSHYWMSRSIRGSVTRCGTNCSIQVWRPSTHPAPRPPAGVAVRRLSGCTPSSMASLDTPRGVPGRGDRSVDLPARFHTPATLSRPPRVPLSVHPPTPGIRVPHSVSVACRMDECSL
jgi:hypothetical protein